MRQKERVMERVCQRECGGERDEIEKGGKKEIEREKEGKREDRI